MQRNLTLCRRKYLILHSIFIRQPSISEYRLMQKPVTHKSYLFFYQTNIDFYCAICLLKISNRVGRRSKSHWDFTIRYFKESKKLYLIRFNTYNLRIHIQEQGITNMLLQEHGVCKCFVFNIQDVEFVEFCFPFCQIEIFSVLEKFCLRWGSYPRLQQCRLAW